MYRFSDMVGSFSPKIIKNTKKKASVRKRRNLNCAYKELYNSENYVKRKVEFTLRGGIFIKKIIATLGFAALVTIGFNNQAYAAEKDVTKKKVIIIFKDNQSKNRTVTLNNNGEVGRDFKNIPAISAELTKTAINNLKRNPDVLSVEYNKEVTLLENPKTKNVSAKSINLAKQTESYGINSVKAKEAWKRGITGKGVKVAILDTGVEFYHKDLKIEGGISFVKEVLDNGTLSKGYDDFNGHGTHVAGIIGAKNNNIGTVGVAPDSKLYAVKVLDGSGDGTIEDIVAGIDWCITNRMDVVNLSIGSPEGSPTYQAIVKKAKEKGVIVVAASGNDNLKDNSGVDYPAKYPEVVGVAAVDKYNKHADFSSVGPEVDVAAPGVSILSTYVGGKYEYMSGTSMAAPYTTGVVALYKSAYPKAKVEDILKVMYTNIVDVDRKGFDNKTGRGLVQAPTTSGEIPIEFNSKITTFGDNYLYASPKDGAKMSAKIGPQVLQAVQKEGNFILVKTWLGNRYIKTNLYVEGIKNVVTKKITLSENASLYSYPFESYKTKVVISPQTVYSLEEINGWYLIKTWVGNMYIRPQNAIVENYKEVVNLPFKESLFSQPDSKYNTGTTIGPQTVTAMDKRGSYYLINTGNGAYWVSPKYPIIGNIEQITEKITLKERKDLYSLPFENRKTGAALSTNQTVEAFEKWGNWVHIKTWLGDKWIQQK
ncbi:S8 family peptidase [Bacillus thuringiensis]|uniref:Peptidase S8/S53 domain-containing protein n=2 Tax=Bacillus cereus group TaxID=86661 RepID=A0A9X6WGU9_BACTU|nr:S8 family peptidase [Bacillus thuringiensis]PFJ29172.1 hypothetical protein COJ15_32170 [Bacillus thuringiensis]